MAAKGLLSTAPKKATAKPTRAQTAAKAQKQFQRTTAAQQQGIIQGQGQSVKDLTDFGNTQFQGVKDAYSQPFDLSQAGAVPTNDEAYRSSIEQANIDRFNRQYDKQFSREKSDFEMMAGQRGWTPGSEVYNNEKTRLEGSQNTARENAIDQARISGGAEQQRLFDMQSQTYGTNRDNYVATRDRPQQEYAATQGLIAQNPLWNQWSQNSQQNFQGQQAQLDRNQTMKIAGMNRGGGGGGGSDPFMGFGSAQGLWDAQDARSRANAEYGMQLDQKYNPKPKQVSPYAQLGGGILGSFANGFASNLGKGIFGG